MIPESIAAAAAFSMYVRLPPAVITGASFAGVIEMVEVAAAEFNPPSFTTHEMVRPDVGTSALDEKVTDRSAV